MNRRRFLKASALTAAALPVIGLPALSTTAPAITPDPIKQKPREFHVDWRCKNGDGGRLTSDVLWRAQEWMDLLIVYDIATKGKIFADIYLHSSDNSISWCYK